MVVFFLSVSILPAANLFRPAAIGPHFDWPDETMNFFFAKQFAETRQFRASNENEFIRPRSFNIFHGSLVPGGFLGLPLLYGAGIWIISLPGKNLGVLISLFFTSTLAATALLAFAGLSRRIIGRRQAILAALLLAANPIYWYYSAYSFLPNVPFFAFAIFSIYFFMIGLTRGDCWRYGLATIGGFCAAIALAIRSNETLWLIMSGAAAITMLRLWRNWRYLAVAAIATLIFFAPILYFQNLTFGGAFATGYSRFTSAGIFQPTEFSGAASSPLSIAWRALTLPYGLHPRVIWFNFKNAWSALGFFSSVSLAAAAFWFIAKREKTIAHKAFSAVLVIVTVWLTIAYGSWVTSDPLMTKLNTIGLPHLRYFLPVLALASLPLANFVGSLLESRSRVAKMGAAVFIAVFVSLSAAAVFWQNPDSLIHVATRIRSYNKAAGMVSEKTPSRAVVITDRTDKEIFSDREVTPSIPSKVDGTLAALDSVICKRPVYFYLSDSRMQDGALAELLDHWQIPKESDQEIKPIVEPRRGYHLREMNRSECKTN